MNKIIIDADPGVDDAFAIALAVKSKKFDLLGISVVAGNCSLKNGINNTFKILELVESNTTKVFKGSKKSLKRKKINAANVHGNNGFGGVKYKKVRRKVEKENAIDFLIKSVNENPHEITIVALGPLTNIAKAILKDKEFVNNVKDLIIMGGAYNMGNITTYAEFNFYKDPHAAKIVFDSNIKNIKLFNLNATTKLPLKEVYEEKLKNNKTMLAQILYEATRIGAEFDRKQKYDGLILNDPLTIAYLIDNDVVELNDVNIEMILEGEKIGESKITFVEYSNIKMTKDADSQKFYDILFKNLFI